MQSTPGIGVDVNDSILHYKVVDRLGEGGMGQVYKALDTRLNRHVAIKVLRQTDAGNGDRRARFVQEARAASALNHPNIITIHDIFAEHESDFMVMEYVSGLSLADLIPKGGMKVSKIITIGTQIADALATAHEAGIIHRDLKPGNIMIARNGSVKLLDFGLAKLTRPDDSSSDSLNGDSSDNETKSIAGPVTIEGTVLGTARYMSPEQAQGLPLDARSDIFTFGAVLYEMATGQPAFQAGTTISTLAAVIRDEPKSIMEVADDIPLALVDVIQHSMCKDPADRPQSMREVLQALLDLKQTWDSVLRPPQTAHSVAGSTQSEIFGSASQSGTAPARPPLSGGISASSHPAPVAPPASRSRAMWMPMVAFAFIAGAGVVWWTTQRTGDTPALPAPVSESSEASPPPPSVEPPAQTVEQAPALAAQMPETSPEVSRTAPATQPHESPGQTATTTATLPDATPVVLRLTSDIPADAKGGDSVRFKAVRAVKSGNTIVIPEGAEATAKIEGEARKRLLRDAKATMLFVSINGAGGTTVKLRESASNERKPRSVEPSDRASRSKDKSIAAPAGTEYVAYTDGAATVRVNTPQK